MLVTIRTAMRRIWRESDGWSMPDAALVGPPLERSSGRKGPIVFAALTRPAGANDEAELVDLADRIVDRFIASFRYD